ncbi:DinB family protein [Paucisalibacillus sp. EB02]|uniref:DinB family protein n=1 Tax=Paucisalibacillus sp. EB02 TaxID=1347087 RepID=UPI0005A74126|nr:DinB family protein [Paucisalibacillus sp. EB02]
MYRMKEDFLQEWTIASQGTLKVLEALTDDKLDQAITEGHNTLGWLGWHLATSLAFFGGQVGLKVEAAGGPNDVPSRATEIVLAYRQASEQLKQEVEKWTDEQFVEAVDSFAGKVPRGSLLRSMIDHQTHHRGQMTVLLRQAGLKVPGVMGPTQEDQM